MSMQGAGGNLNTLKIQRTQPLDSKCTEPCLHEGITAPQQTLHNYRQSGFALAGISKHITQYSVLLAPIWGIL